MSLNYIFHLSDLHIRNGDIIYSRYDEYKQVFKETIMSISKQISVHNLSFNDFVIIITGDIFHNKNNVGAYGLMLYKDFIQGLIKLGRVIVLSGNHDAINSDTKQPSLVISSTFDIDNLIILNETKSFIIDDIGFSYVNITDTLDTFKNSGRNQDLPPFPTITEKVKYKVALFHGSFASAKLFNGENYKDEYNPYPLEWVQDFDFVLLGDIHKRQIAIYKKKTYYGYSGSLLQQNFGEDLIDHGYLLWDLNNKKIHEINVFNEIGLINIKQNELEQILIRFNGNYELLLEDVIKDNLEYFPKKLEIKTFSKINFQLLNSLLKSYNISFNIISRLDENKYIGEKYNDTELQNEEQLINVVNNTFILDYFKKYLSPDNYNLFSTIIKDKSSLLFDISKYPEELKDECAKRNKDLIVNISNCVKSNDNKYNKHSFLIRYLEWEGLLCYENKNWLNMTDLDAKTFMVNGRNGTGKSAIYDIITLAIWGEITSLKKTPTLSSGIINYKKNNAYTIIDIEVNGILYRIERDFIKRKKLENKIHNLHKYLYKFINNKDLELINKESACENKITELFGTVDDFLSSSMITQNVDCDILKLEAKNTLEIIDKSFNIVYIYHLNNLFKNAITKYKDFKKVIESKKQVYEKLVSTNKVDVIDEKELSKNKQLLEELTTQKEDLFSSFNSIQIDIKSYKTQTILKTNYNKLINDLNINFDIDDYNKYKELFNELNFLLKDETDLLKLKQLYDPSITIDETNKKIKPCELSFINNEEQLLKQFNNYEIKNKTNYTEKDLELLKSNYYNLELLLKDTISKQPIKVNDPIITKDAHLKVVYTIYTSVDDLNAYISTHLKDTKLKTKLEIKTSYDNYKQFLEKELILKDKIKLNSNKLVKLENDFKITFKKQQDLKVKNKPTTAIKLRTSSSILKEINKIDIKTINRLIENDAVIINKYFQQNDKLDNLEKDLKNYNIELQLFNSNDEYKYNPNCEVCCKRHWVFRIKTLETTITTIQNDIKLLKTDINKIEDDFILTYERNDNNIKLKESYELLNEWYEYYKSKEVYDIITTNLNKIITEKDITNKEIIKDNDEIIAINVFYQQFNNISYDLYATLLNIDLYDKYKQWLDLYEKINGDYNNIKTTIADAESYINYNTNIKPRINNLKLLKSLYNDWLEYENKFKIVKTHQLFTLKDLIERYDKYQEYTTNNNLKPSILTKIKLNDDIKDIDIKIKEVNNKIITSKCINGYNKENLDSYNELFIILTNIDNVIAILEIIISNFQTFKIDLYDKYVLNQLTNRANNIIKSLCHNNTKPFKLNYLISVFKENIHINWLINNEQINNFDEGEKQIIPVSQASGFQYFVISLALRMSLFANKQEIVCNQLFIDEAFINFDKDNLSIVPNFIKNLLSYFNNIIVVSHIDLIKDNIDETTEIKYNKLTNVSSIEYNNYKKVIKRQNKKQMNNNN
jgi:exonuclease SbcC